MILYHGTNEDIKAIDLTRGMRHKDFGKGFQALRFLHKTNVEIV